MKKLTVSENLDSDRLQLFFHLIPVVGFFPSLWTLYRHESIGSRESGVASREDKEDLGDSIHNPKFNIQNSLTTHSEKEKLAISRLSVTLALSWLLVYFLLGAGAETSEFLNFRLLMLNSLLTSGYFLVSLWLMLRLVIGKSVRLPGFSALADRATIEKVARSAEGIGKQKAEG